ncbi:MAG TPA: three-Cys-motif partner protein TcmP [Chitinophagales bacterium]|nr:three-Cys-motif partner protein TcmP [Chitinophagales bacterium]
MSNDNLMMVEDSGDDWGGPWTQSKIDIFLKYLKAYLQIMKKQKFKLIYFDGFAGSGKIESGNYSSLIESVALQVLAISDPTAFDMYYLVELKEKKSEQLKQVIKEKFPDKKQVYIVAEDCNDKLVGLANFLREHKNYRALAFIDPHGMEVNWSSLESFKGLSCDMWILVPTGIGVNRMLKKDGTMQESWIKKLEKFLGISEEEINKEFYQQRSSMTLFGEEKTIVKETRAIEKINKLYSKRLGTVWKFVSSAYPMTNSTGSIMFHFLMASQIAAGKKIADDIIGKMK